MPAGFSLRTAYANRRAPLYYERHGLRLLGDDRHPVTSLPVRYYAWTPRDHDAPDRSVRIYLLRHGETEWNAAGRFQGALDSALTQRGVLQARASGRRLASLIARADAVHASPLGRTRETYTHVTAFGAYPDVEWEHRLREVSLGSWDGLTDIDIEQGWPGRLDGASPFDWYFRSPTGESYDEAAVRVRIWLSGLEGTIVAVSHGLPSRIIGGVYLALPREEALALPVPQDVVWRLADGQVTAFQASQARRSVNRGKSCRGS